MAERPVMPKGHEIEFYSRLCEADPWLQQELAS